MIERWECPEHGSYTQATRSGACGVCGGRTERVRYFSLPEIKALLTADERCQVAAYDAQASVTAEEYNRNAGIPAALAAAVDALDDAIPSEGKP